ncbi:MAG TPA: hypothetical protein VFJ13_05145, partial [Paracoccaceae bacterium]|nr:hypothetical protein [Paracoccaceae bacterium]
MQVPAAFVASLAAALIAAAPGLAAETPAEPWPQAEAPAEPPAGAPLGPDRGLADAAQGAHLEALFAELADPMNEHWESTQAQIYAAWSESGSASMDLLA